MKSLSDRAGFLILANFFKYAVGFALPMVLVRLLSVADYGTYQQLQLIGSVALAIMVLGLPVSVYYFFGRGDPAGRARLRIQTVVLLAIAGAVTGLAIIAGAPLIAQRFSNPALLALIIPYAISVALMIAGEHFTNFMIAEDRYRMAVMIEMVETVLRVVVMIGSLALGYGLWGLPIALAGYAAVRLIARNLLLFVYERPGERVAPGPSFVRAQFAYSLPLALTGCVGLVGGLLDRALVAAFFTPVAYAIYSVGALEIPLDTIFQSSVANVLRASFPNLVAERRYAEMARLLAGSVRKLSLIVIPSVVFLFGHASDFIAFLFTQKYIESVTVFRIYLGLVPLHMFVLSLLPQVFGRTRLSLQIVIATSTFHLAFSYLLLKTIGFYGPGISAVVTQWLNTLFYLVIGLRLTHSKVSDFIPWRSLLHVLVVSLFALAASLLPGYYTESPALRFLCGAALFSVTWLVLALATGVLTSDDRALIWRWTARWRGVAR
jgi:O-antigen/teichoic acid export membrane protein